MEHHVELTQMQKMLWTEWKLKPKSHYYNINVRFKLEGTLDYERFRRAIDYATNHFEAFRTSFIEKEVRPIQVIRDTANVPLNIIDLTNSKECTDQEGHINATQLLDNIAFQPIVLTNYPLMKFCLVKLSPRMHYFIIVTPHIISDGFSGRILLETISTAYNASSDDALNITSNGSIKDYLHIRHQEENHIQNEKAKQHWLRRLQGAPLCFASDNFKPTQTTKGKRFFFSVPTDQHEKLRKLARQERTTIFTLLATSFGAFLNRYFEKDEVVFTYPINIRKKGYKNLFGFYINNLPLRLKFEKEYSFSQAIRQTTATRKEDRNFETFPFSDITRALRASGESIPQNAFNLSFGQTSLSLEYLTLDGLNITPLRPDMGDVHYDLSLQYDDSTEQLELFWEYKTEMFCPEAIKQLSDAFLIFLEAGLCEPDRCIKDLPILSKKQTKEIVTLGTTPSLHPSTNVSIDQRFSAQAKETPNHVAVFFETHSLTYCELDIHANQLAHYLKTQGIKQGSYVAVSMERSQEMVVALLAILKTGAAYIPIDPAQPNKRIAAICDDAQPTLLLTQEKYAQKYVALSTQIISLNNHHIQNALSHSPSNVPKRHYETDDTAYIIYTSGSTGTPKGVQVSHSNVCSRLDWLQRTMHLSKHDKLLQSINFSFDPSVYEFFWPITVGATLVVPKTGITKNPCALIECIEQHNITCMTFVPSLLRLFLMKLQKNQCSSLKHIICGGEILTPQLVQDFNTLIPMGALYNAYGPTEATILATCFPCPKEPLHDVIPIGKALDDTPIYIINSNNQLQPLGIIGEICIGGSGVAQGYLNRPKLNNDKFISDIFSENSQFKLYKTGDLGRLQPNGSIEFLGRIDEQVKLRGFRLELEEIERAIQSSPDVTSAIVTFSETNNVKQIIAYVSPSQCDVENIRAHISDQLPDYMAPNHFIGIDTIPITANGKLDKAALPQPNKVVQNHEHYATATEMEQAVCRVWAALLKRSVTSLNLNTPFFDAGGDSLQAVELAIMLQEQFGGNISDTIIFEKPTISSLAIHLQSNSTRQQEHQINNAQLSDRIQKRRAKVATRKANFQKTHQNIMEKTHVA